jgi:hypothetical protein
VELLGRSAAPDQTVLRLDPHQVRLDGEPVDPEAYRLAAPDPIAPRSDALVTHLVQRHTDQVMALAELLDRRLVDAAWMIAPACIDRFGLTFHLAGPAGVAYPRLDFPVGVRHPNQLPAALRPSPPRGSRALRTLTHPAVPYFHDAVPYQTIGLRAGC